MKREDAEKLLEVYNLCLEYFEGDKERARMWMFMPNPLLDQYMWTPFQMIQMGMTNRLLRHMKEKK